MAHVGGASAAGVGAALLRQRSVNILRGVGVRCASPHRQRVSALSSVSCRFPCFSPINILALNGGSGASCSSGTRRSFSSSSGAAPSHMLVDKPRPTEYQTEIFNEATDVKPGVEQSSTKGIILLTTLLIVVPIVHTKYELHKYYSEYGHFYKTGWDLYHYDKGKSTYLS